MDVRSAMHVPGSTPPPRRGLLNETHSQSSRGRRKGRCATSAASSCGPPPRCWISCPSMASSGGIAESCREHKRCFTRNHCDPPSAPLAATAGARAVRRRARSARSGPGAPRAAAGDGRRRAPSPPSLQGASSIRVDPFRPKQYADRIGAARVHARFGCVLRSRRGRTR